MLISKTNPILALGDSYLVSNPSPVGLGYMWSFGSLLGLILGILIVSGIALAMHYMPVIDLAFNSVEHIMRDVSFGWFLRYLHANAVSLFFICVYLHIGRGLYFGSYSSPRGLLWSIGVIIFLVMMGTAFIGYVLPWGQMSYWGATVITSLAGAIPFIGHDLVELIWGGSSVDGPTLQRFFALHYLLPFILAALVALHLIALFRDHSNNPLGIASSSDRLRFHPYFTSKDLIGFIFAALFLAYLVCFSPNLLGHPDNYIPADSLVTPHSIVPEWYFLPFYAILRAIPSKGLGVAAMIGAILILLLLPLAPRFGARSTAFRPAYKLLFWFFVFNFFALGYLGP